MMKILIFLFYFVTLSIACFTMSHAANDESSQTEQTTKKQTKSTSKTETAVTQSIGKRGQVKPLEEFIPSEEVSADKPVAFPSDI